jgi:hypothetical protein
MALQNDPRMYSGGAVVVNTQPSVNLYAQQLQRKQAREEALDAYEMNRMNRMNEQGVRDIDRPGLDQKVLDMKMYYQANKERIRKGGTPEAYNYEKMFRDTLGGVAKSKNATARAETFNKIRLERQKLGRNTPEDWFNEYTQHEDTPIWDEKFQDLDLPKYMQQNQVKYDPKIIKDLFGDMKRTPGSPRYEAIPGDRFTRNEFTDETFDSKAKETIAARAHDLYDANDGFASSVQQDVNNPVKRGQLEQLAIKEFGSAPQSMADYAAAKVLSELQPTVTKAPKKLIDWEARQAYLQKFKEANIRLGLFLRGVNPNQPFDLTNYTVTDDGQYDITQPLKGVAMNRRKTGESLYANKVLFNPQTQEFTYFDPVDKIAIRKPYTQFIQDVQTNNPGIDIKFIQNMRNPVGTVVPKNQQGGVKPQPKTPTMVTVVLSDGRTGQIPSDKVAQFLKDNPGSKKQ